jgi:phosphohistidine phosphatase
MKLYLVRHATPKPAGEDPARPLSGKGIEEAGVIASFLMRGTEGAVRRILHSGKRRARETAEIIADHLDLAGGVEETDGLRPNDNPAIWGDRCTVEDEDVMLVGHLPHLERLAAFLVCGETGGGIMRFAPASAACLARDDDGAWSIEWVITPGVLS